MHKQSQADQNRHHLTKNTLKNNWRDKTAE